MPPAASRQTNTLWLLLLLPPLFVTFASAECPTEGDRGIWTVPCVSSDGETIILGVYFINITSATPIEASSSGLLAVSMCSFIECTGGIDARRPARADISMCCAYNCRAQVPGEIPPPGAIMTYYPSGFLHIDRGAISSIVCRETAVVQCAGASAGAMLFTGGGIRDVATGIILIRCSNLTGNTMYIPDSAPTRPVGGIIADYAHLQMTNVIFSTAGGPEESSDIGLALYMSDIEAISCAFWAPRGGFFIFVANTVYARKPTEIFTECEFDNLMMAGTGIWYDFRTAFYNCTFGRLDYFNIPQGERVVDGGGNEFNVSFEVPEHMFCGVVECPTHSADRDLKTPRIGSFLPAECTLCVISNCTVCIAGWLLTIILAVVITLILFYPAKVLIVDTPDQSEMQEEDAGCVTCVDEEEEKCDPPAPIYLSERSRCPSLLNPCVSDGELFVSEGDHEQIPP